MTRPSESSEFRVVKERVGAVLTLSNGQTPRGSFFVAGGSPRHDGNELVGELLNAEDGLFPFEVEEVHGRRTVLFNRSHVVIVAIPDNEAVRDPGYLVATERMVSVLLASGQRLVGAVRVFLPERSNRISDWARSPKRFHYLQTSDGTLIVNAAYIIEVSEVPEA